MAKKIKVRRKTLAPFIHKIGNVMTPFLTARFKLGGIQISHVVNAAVPDEEIAAALVRHSEGKWNCSIDPCDNLRQDYYLEDNIPAVLLSEHTAENGFHFVVFTLGDRSRTYVAIFDEYLFTMNQSGSFGFIPDGFPPTAPKTQEATTTN